MRQVIAAEPAKVAEYRGGRDKLFGFFVGAGDEGDGRQGQSEGHQRHSEAQARGLSRRTIAVLEVRRAGLS